MLNNAEQARHLSSQKLAQLAGISQSSVVKFAQKLGYKGFPALKLALSETLAQPQAEPVVTVHNHILSSDTLKTVGENCWRKSRRRCARRWTSTAKSDCIRRWTCCAGRAG